MLGPLLEEHLRRAMSLARGDPTLFFTRPLSLAFMIGTGIVHAAMMAHLQDAVSKLPRRPTKARLPYRENAMLRQVLLFAAVLSFAGPAAAQGKPEVFSDRGAAIRGYDPVAYFSDAKPVKGSEQFTHQWKGASWRFASAANRERFAAVPEKYAPQYGGYCAYAVAHGYTASIDPDAWSVVDGKLYLNYSPSVRAQWRKDVPGFIRKADANWPGVLAK
jgi:hypothetical protein